MLLLGVMTSDLMWDCVYATSTKLNLIEMYICNWFIIFFLLLRFTLYCQKYWVTPSNERFDYFKICTHENY